MAESSTTRRGSQGDDIFDNITDGVNETLLGFDGSDVYWLRHGTSCDEIQEDVLNSGNPEDIDSIRVAADIKTEEVRLTRSGNDLLVELMHEDGYRTDWLRVKNYYTNAAAQIERVEFDGRETVWNKHYIEDNAAFRGDSTDEDLYGSTGNDLFDSSEGGTDTLLGGRGDDTYRLTGGTGNDTIDESFLNSETGDSDDKIRIAAGIGVGGVQLTRDGYDLLVELTGVNDGNSLRVKDYYLFDKAEVDSIEFEDSETTWQESDIRGLSALRGSSGEDTFNRDDGIDDRVLGGLGNDEYQLGRGTGHDTIQEYEGNSGSGDAGDKIKIKSGFTAAEVTIRRVGANLLVELAGSENSLTVENYYSDVKARIESIEFSDGSVIRGHEQIMQAAAFKGTSGNDEFDTEGGFDDILRGFGGNDVYWLGHGIGHDIIEEAAATGDMADVIRLKAGISSDRVELAISENGEDLIVKLKDSEGALTDSLTVRGFYTGVGKRIEEVQLADGETVIYSEAMLDALPADKTLISAALPGGAGADVYDLQGGAGSLFGLSGNDTYWLGSRTGHHMIQEFPGLGDDTIRVKSAVSREEVRFRRTNDGWGYVVEILGSSGRGQPLNRREALASYTVNNAYLSAGGGQVEEVGYSDGTVWRFEEFGNELAITGTAADGEVLTAAVGRGAAEDIFDGDAGGDDMLRGADGNDEYRLGRGTGHDTIQEYEGNSGSGDAGDKIKIKSGFTAAEVSIRRVGANLLVELAGGEDSLMVENYYSDVKARIENIEFSDGSAIRGHEQIMQAAAFKGTSGNDEFDTEGGYDDILQGEGGNDVYWLGYGIGHDIIEEAAAAGDMADVIRLKAGISGDRVEIAVSENGEDLIVKLKDSEGALTDSLTVRGFYTGVGRQIEGVELADGETVVYSEAMLDALPADKTLISTALSGGVGADVYDLQGGAGSLFGLSGNDIYWLGNRTGHHMIQEFPGLGDDTIRVKSAVSREEVRFRRTNDGWGYVVEILGSSGRGQPLNRREALASYTVNNAYLSAGGGQVEEVGYSDGTVWRFEESGNELAITGTAADGEILTAAIGRGSAEDIFDSDAGGDDMLRGADGNDEYRLGRGTGHDTIQEYEGNSGSGDAGDKIKIKSGIADEDVRIGRAGADLLVQLVSANGRVVDSLRVEKYFAAGEECAKVEMIEYADGRTSAIDDSGLPIVTVEEDGVFDTTGGTNDVLLGGGGNDEYRLGRGTGHDTIQEYAGSNGDGGGDKIKIKSGIADGDVRIGRAGTDLLVQLTGSDGRVTDSLRVANHFALGGAAARVETLEYAGGRMQIIEDGGLPIVTVEEDGVFDTAGGTDETLLGGAGNDEYRLGRGTGHDTIREYAGSNGSSGGDKIKIKSGIADGDVRIGRAGSDLLVQLTGADGRVTDSLRVANHFAAGEAAARVETLEFAGGRMQIIEDGGLPIVAFEEDGVFDTTGGTNDVLLGGAGNDEYRLGRGTGHDTIQEYAGSNGSSGGGDKIKIKSGIADEDVRIGRAGSDLLVQLTGSDGRVTDSLKVENHFAAVGVAARVEKLEFAGGRIQTIEDGGLPIVTFEEDGVFDTAGGTDETLLGGGGNDEYRLGRGTGHDQILEDGGEDRIRVESGILSGNVWLSRIGSDLMDLRVEVRDAEGAVTDSLTVAGYYSEGASRKIEFIEFMNEAGEVATSWDKNKIAEGVVIRGSAGDDDELRGSPGNDKFDSDEGGDDTLLGGGGNDVYMLGKDTGHDTIQEEAAIGDMADVIRVEKGIGEANVRVRVSGDDLIVEIIDDNEEATASLTVKGFYTGRGKRIERVEYFEGEEIKVLQSEPELDALKGGGMIGNMVPSPDGNSLDNVYDSSKTGADGLPISDEHMEGTRGNDTYWLGHGTGHDVIHEYIGNNPAGDGDDRIKIKSDVAAGTASLTASGYDLVVKVGENDSLTVKDYYKQDNAKIEVIEFSDGTEWDEDDIPDNSVIIGGGGNDLLNGDTGHNDVLRGGGGNDVYILGDGTDHDLIEEAAVPGDMADVIRLKEGISGDRVQVRASGDDLIVELKDRSDGVVTDSLTVKDFYADGRSRIERIELADGAIVAQEGVKLDEVHFSTLPAGRTLVAPNQGWNPPDGTSGEDVYDPQGGNAGLEGNSGNDIYWLGYGTGAHWIREWLGTGGGDDAIRIKSNVAREDVRITRSADGWHYVVEVLDPGTRDQSHHRRRATGLYVADTAYYGRSFSGGLIEQVEFSDGTVWNWRESGHLLKITGNPGQGGVLTANSDSANRNDGDRAYIVGTDDIFDSDAGGNHILRGLGGDDVYWLGRGTEHDTIQEYFRNSGAGDDGDTIKIKADIANADVRLGRAGDDLLVQLIDAGGRVSDSLKVEKHFDTSKPSAKVEKIHYSDGSMRTMPGKMELPIVSAEENGVFDTEGGTNDRLLGGGGEDVYILCAGTGHDTIEEIAAIGDMQDVIRLGQGISGDRVQVRASGDDLIVELKDRSDGVVTDSLTVKDFYADGRSRIERIELADGAIVTQEGVKLDEVHFSTLPTGRTLTAGRNGRLPIDGTVGKNVYNSSGINSLEGGAGDDIYWLGRGTGSVWIREFYSGGGDDVIRIKSDVDSRDVRIHRSSDGYHYHIELLDPTTRGQLNSERRATDFMGADAAYRGGGSYTEAVVERVEFADGTVWHWSDFAHTLEIMGERKIDTLYSGGGRFGYPAGGVDIFDSDGGGDDKLQGGIGNDIYWLGDGTDNDTIQEDPGGRRSSGDDGDTIKIKSNILEGAVQLFKSGYNLVVKLFKLVGNRITETGNSLTVEGYYGDSDGANEAAQIEFIEFDGKGIIWNRQDIAKQVAVKRGTAGDDGASSPLAGTSGADIFDANAGGNDVLKGNAGDDEYWLGFGTGNDMIREGETGVNDTGDVIKIKSEITDITDVRLRKVGMNLVVEIRDAGGTVTDSLTVQRQFENGFPQRKVERIEAAGQALVESQFINLIDALAVFDAGNSRHGWESAVYNEFWENMSPLTTPGS